MSGAEQILEIMRGWIGKREADGTHKPIIDTYNEIKPLPAGYRMTYKDAWCAAAISAAAYRAGLTDAVHPECSCNRMIGLYKTAGEWQPRGYEPAPGDLIFYSWNKNGSSDHVGIVEKNEAGQITAIEGNKNDAVERRTIRSNSPYIIGYGTPKYPEEKAENPQESPAADHPEFTAAQFLEIIREDVIRDAQETGILPSLTAAQALIESGRGNSALTRLANNLFGIKRSTDWTGETVTMPTTEYINGTRRTVIADFKKYRSWKDSIHDHSQLFLKYDRYKNLRGVSDYRTACEYVAADGYATSPTYSDTLKKTIEKHGLQAWDQKAQDQPQENPGAYKIGDFTLQDIKQGDKGPHVQLAQQLLLARGYGIGPDGADGEFGPMTARAVLLWMADHKGARLTREIWEQLMP